MIDDARALYLKYGGREHLRIEREMRVRGQIFAQDQANRRNAGALAGKRLKNADEGGVIQMLEKLCGVTPVEQAPTARAPAVPGIGG